MKKPIFVKDQSIIGYSTDIVFSADGTLINYYQLGYGPGIVLLHGSMESAQSHMRLARALSDEFTVYLPERRGHHPGGSKDYSMQKEVEDLSALLAKTGAQAVFGVSSGGLIGLQAALALPAIKKLAVYEPALIVNNSISTAFLPRYEKEIAEGKIAEALVTAMKGARLGPPVFHFIPRWLITSLTKMFLKKEDKNPGNGNVTMRMLAPTLHYDFQLVAGMAGSLNVFGMIKAEVLLLSGSKSPSWLRSALDPLEKILPNVRRFEFPGLDHGGSSDESSTNRGGNPELVASAMGQFFSGKAKLGISLTNVSRFSKDLR